MKDIPLALLKINESVVFQLFQFSLPPKHLLFCTPDKDI